MLKNGEYDLNEEDILLTLVSSLVGYDSERVNNLITKKLGLIPLIEKREIKLEK